MNHKNLVTLVLSFLLISTVSALEINLLEEQEPTYKVTIEGSDIETITIEITKEEIINMIQEVKQLENNWNKFLYFINKFDLNLELIKTIGGY